jgi:hypothetical protein
MSNIKPYDIQTVSLAPNDVILCHISEDCGLEELRLIQNELKTVFPNNIVLVANEHILKRITIFKAENPIQATWLEDEVYNTIQQEVNSLGITGTYEGTSVYDILY